MHNNSSTNHPHNQRLVSNQWVAKRPVLHVARIIFLSITQCIRFGTRIPLTAQSSYVRLDFLVSLKTAFQLQWSYMGNFGTRCVYFEAIDSK